MLRICPVPPLDYQLCNQTVTLYHAELGEEFQCIRTVFHGAHLDSKKVQTTDKLGSKEANSFLLVLPSGWKGRPCWKTDFHLAAGDKVILGEGPLIEDRAAWAAFVPVKVPGLVVVKDVDVKYWNGRVCHIEAGG